MKIPGISTIRNLSLRSKMVAGGILILMVPVMIIGSVTFIKSYSATENIAKTQFMQIAGTISGMISIALQKDLKVVNGIASNPVVIDEMSRGAYTEGGKIIAGIYQMLATDYESIAIFDTDGIIRANAATGRSIGIGIADRAYFIAAREGRASVDTMVFSKATGNPIFGICAPVKAGSGKFMGGVLGVVKADYLMRYISSIKLGTTGYAFILDRSGTIIVHPEESLILNRTIFMDPGLKGISGKMMGLSAGTEEYIFRGSKKIAGFTPVDFVGWSVAVTQNKSEIMSLVYSNTGFIIMICGIFVVLTVIAVFYLSGTISIPVQTTLATLRQAIEQASEAFVIVGLDRRVQYANPASLAMSGQPMEEFRTSPSDFAGPSKEKALEIWKAVENGKIWNGRMKGRKADGTDFSIDFSLTPVRDGSGRIICYLGVGRDISREMMMQERVSHGQKLEAMGTLAGGIAHDFNNILTAIFGYTELSIRSADSREKQERYLMEILNASKRARELVNHILAFSRRSETVEKVIVPKYIIKEALTLLRASLPSTIEIRENLLSPAQIKGDPTRLHQMTMNLCTNAWYAMREHGGILEVSLEEIVPGNDFLANHPGLPSGPCLELRISDTGSGIPSGIIERIFDPFFTTKPAGEGTGLGLSVVHGTVLSMKGVITVRSEEGKGTVFSVYLPVAHDVMECGDEEAEEGLLPGSERILLLDDEKSIAESVMELLKRQGYSVSAFTDSALAWERFSGTPEAFDAVITDYTMPHMTGVEFATRIRGLRRDIPVIICSGNFSLEEKLEEIGNVEFVKKPVMIQELSGCLRRMLDRAAPGDKGEC